MKKLLSLSAAAVAAMVLASSASAQVISVEFTGGAAITASQTAGVIPELGSTWNIDNSSVPYFTASTTGISNLMDSTGATTTVSETKTAEAYYGPNGATTGFASAGDNTLFSGGPFTGYTAATNPSALDLTGLNASLTYNLFVYVRNAQPADGASLTATDSLDSQTYTIGSTIGDEGTGYVIASGGTAVGNYFEFTGLTGSSSLEVDLASPGNAGFTLDGFQLQVAGGSVSTPEPSAIWLLSLGLLSVGFFVRRNRAAREI